jgi:hypothetical protein
VKTCSYNDDGRTWHIKEVLKICEIEIVPAKVTYVKVQGNFEIEEETYGIG